MHYACNVPGESFMFFVPEQKWRIKLRNDKLQKLMNFIQKNNGTTSEDCKIMFEEIKKKKYKRVLELGVSKGHSTIPLLIAMHLNRGKLVSCDKVIEHKLDEWLIRFKCEFLAKYWKFWVGNDLELEFDGKYDMIFLDTSHIYYHTVAELKKFAKWSDVIFCHDFKLNGVKIPANEFINENKDWQLKVFETGCGLGRLSKR